MNRVIQSDGCLLTIIDRLDYAWDDRTYQLMIKAQSCMQLDLEAQEKQQAFIDDKASYGEVWHTSLELIGTHLRDIIVPPLDPTIRIKPAEPSTLLTQDLRINSWVQRHLKQPFQTMDGDPTFKLNPTQIQAIAMALNERFSLIQGPPGTGKSATITNLVHLLKFHFQVPVPILVCAPTHAAVDHLTQGMLNKGLRPLRLGREELVREDLRQFTMDQWHTRSPDYFVLCWARKRETIARAIVDAMEKGEDLEALGFDIDPKLTLETAQANFKKAKNVSRGIYDKITQWVYSQADVVLSTAMGSGGFATRTVDFPIVLLDEAAQCNEVRKPAGHYCVIS